MNDKPVRTISYRKEIPVKYETDVLVVGCGVAGTVAAVASAREGAKTMVIDRFGQIGGNIGPGHIGGAPSLELPEIIRDGIPGVGGEIIRRVEELTGHSFLLNYFDDSLTYSYVALKMFKEEGIQTLFNVYLGDVIKDGDTVKGVIVETKDGPWAIAAGVVIDTTGDADVATKAGAPVDAGPNHYFHSGMYFSIGNVDIDAYKVVGEAEIEPDDLRWMGEADIWCNNHAYPLLPYMRRSYEDGDFRYTWHGDYGAISADHGVFYSSVGVTEPPIVDPLRMERYGIVGGLAGLHFTGTTSTSGNPSLMTELENNSREYIFELHRFLKKYVPGFDRSYLHSIGAYYNARGGRSMIARHNICQEDLENAAEFDDMVFRGHAGHSPVHPLWELVHNYRYSVEIPYRQFLPREIEGLLAAGRSCNLQGGSPGDPGRGAILRMRWLVMMMGHTVGTAAAMAVRDGVPPSGVDVLRLRKKLYAEGFPMSDSDARNKELGLEENGE